MLVLDLPGIDKRNFLLANTFFGFLLIMLELATIADLEGLDGDFDLLVDLLDGFLEDRFCVEDFDDGIWYSTPFILSRTFWKYDN